MSGTAAEASTTTSSRTKDGIPTWSGEASSFVSYEEAALLWEQSLAYEKRYTAGPRLMQELTGATRWFVSGQPAGWVAYRGGVQVLMTHLRQALGKPRVNEVTDLLATYFKGTRRRSGETMNEYITRKTEAYMRASQALQRVQPHYEAGAATKAAPMDTTNRWTSDRRSSGEWSRQWTPAPESEEPTLRATEEGEEASAEGSTRPTKPRIRGGTGAGHPLGTAPTMVTVTVTAVIGRPGPQLLLRPAPQRRRATVWSCSPFIQGWYLFMDAKGATQTIGSVAAVEAILNRNRYKHGVSKLSGVDASNPPSFSFGNSTENRCLSTAKLKISANGAPGELRIHTLDSGSSPVLLSIETLRRLGAVIDFEHDLMVLRNLDAERVIKLERGQSGHQLMDLTQDWNRNALPTERAVPSLLTFLKR